MWNGPLRPMCEYEYVRGAGSGVGGDAREERGGREGNAVRSWRMSSLCDAVWAGCWFCVAGTMRM